MPELRGPAVSAQRPAWRNSTRRARLPANWYSEIQPTVLARDGRRCQLRFDVCVGEATQVDHKRRGDDHSLGNLQAVCRPCHARKSSAEGAAARPPLRRPPEAHPAFD